MKVGFICLRYGQGGAGNHVRSLALELARKGHDIVVFTGGGGMQTATEARTKVVQLGVTVTRGWPALWSWQLRRNLRKLLDQTRIELDVLNGNPVSGDFANDAKKLGIPYVSTLHGSLNAMTRVERSSPDLHGSRTGVREAVLRMLDASIERDDYLSACRVVAVSPSVLREYESQFGERRGTAVVPPCADMEFFADTAGDERRTTSNGVESAYVLFIGSATRRKGFHFLARSFSAVANQKPGLKIVAVTAGSHADIFQIAVAEGIAGRVECLSGVGRRHLIQLMQGAALLALPSLYEGLPLSAIEAMSQGLPVVGFRTTGVVDAIEHGETGLTVPIGDTQAFAEAMVTILADESMRTHMCQKSREMALARYHPSKIADSYFGVYRDALATCDQHKAVSKKRNWTMEDLNGACR